MIDIGLVDEQVNLNDFLDKDELNYNVPCIFFGFVIKNEYDNKRLCIQPKYAPKKIIHKYKDADGVVHMLPLYGCILPVSGQYKQLSTILIQQQADITISTYKNILEQFDLSCDDCYLHYAVGTYPVDLAHFKRLTNNEISKDKKIFQHILGMEDDEFDFQKMGSLELFILT
jgi:hypothetical protein